MIDVDRKEIVERQPLEIKKNVTIGAPVVTDDRMYVYIRELNELRVYENVVDGGDAFDNTNRVECTAINESSITKKVEETSNICDGHKCENKELKDVKKENITQLITDVNYAVIKGYPKRTWAKIQNIFDVCPKINPLCRDHTLLCESRPCRCLPSSHP